MSYADDVDGLLKSTEYSEVTQSVFSTYLFDLVSTKQVKTKEVSTPIAKFASFSFVGTCRWVSEYLNFAKFLQYFKLLSKDDIYCIDRAIVQLKAIDGDSRIVSTLQNVRLFLMALYDVRR